MKIKPLGTRVLIREDKAKSEQKTKSGIIITATDEVKPNKTGEVVAIGPEVKHLKKGDKVVFNWGDDIKVEDEEYQIVKEEEIIATI